VTDHHLWPATDGPITDSTTDPISLGVEFDVTAPAWLIGFRCWRASAGDTGVTVAAFHVATEAALAGSTTAVPDGGTGWRAVTIDPIALTPGVRYVATAHHPVRYPGTAGYWMPGQPGDGGQTQGPLHAPDNAQVTAAPIGQGRFLLGPSIAAPTQTYQGGGYWITPVVTDVNPGGVSGTATLTAAGALASTGTRRTVGTAALGGTLTAATTGTRRTNGTTALTATGAATTTGTKRAHGPATLDAATQANTAGGSSRHGQAALTAAATLGTTGTTPRRGTAALTATLGATTNGTPTRHGTATLTATATLAGGQAGAPPTAHRIRAGVPRTRWRAGPATT